MGGEIGRADPMLGAYRKVVLAENLGVMHSTNPEIDWSMFVFEASRSNAIYGASNTVQPNALRVLALIKT